MSIPESVPAEQALPAASAPEAGAGTLEAVSAEQSISAEQSALAGQSASAEQAEGAPRGWIAVDLDGTLAYYHSWRGLDHIGKPVKSMLERVKRWREEGYEVRIFTARASSADLIPPVEAWLKKHKIGGLKVTNELDADCIELWDDRCVQLLPNTGMPVRSPSLLARPKAPLLEEAFPHEGRPQLESEAADT